MTDETPDRLCVCGAMRVPTGQLSVTDTDTVHRVGGPCFVDENPFEPSGNPGKLPATSEDIVSRARAALDGITPGPWVRDNPDDRFSEHDDVFSGDVWSRRVAGLISRRADSTFIAAAPDLVRDLLAEVERLRDDLRVERTVTHLCESVDADLREARAEVERLTAERDQAIAAHQRAEARATLHREERVRRALGEADRD